MLDNDRMKNYAIPESLANTILSYLAKRPYDEVFRMVAAMQELQEVPEPKKEPVPK